MECFRLAERLGDTRGIANATVRHESAAILKRLGGRAIARYYDRQYGCQMERIEFYLGDLSYCRFARLAA